ncbi:MAG: hypothetical protein JKX90_01700 [Colwellia sp.]|jgi:hypothetical protein|nr:hypothetical protein [Colwellia sp.]
MKTIKLVTHWTTEQAEDMYRLLDDLKSAVWQSYGEDIVKMHQENATEKLLEEEHDHFNDELPF